MLMTEDRRNVFGEITYGNLQGRKYTPDDIAEVRAGRLLINQPPPPKRKSRGSSDDQFESMIFDSSSSPVPLADCVVRQVVVQHRQNVERGLQLARLEAVFRLKAAGIVEQVFELALGPLAEEKVHVKFRGQRPRIYQNVDPEIITVEGDCDLGHP
jgi:hypothetical protein